MTHVTRWGLDTVSGVWLSKGMAEKPDLEVLAYQERIRRLRVEYQDLKESQKRELTDTGKGDNVTHILFGRREL